MNTPTNERRHALIFRIASISTLVMLTTVLVLTGLEIYVRWTINKDFMFLGGFELETLTASATALILGMLYAYRHLSPTPSPASPTVPPSL